LLFLVKAVIAVFVFDSIDGKSFVAELEELKKTEKFTSLSVRALLCDCGISVFVCFLLFYPFFC